MTDTIPEYAPPYPDLPFEYNGYRRLSMYCRADGDVVREYLPEPLEYVGDAIEVFVLYAPDVSGLAEYWEGGVVVQARYGDVVGAHMLTEYVTSDDALLAGREIWGYPKKMADITFREGDDEIHGTVTRGGVDLIDATFTPREVEFEPPRLFPRLQVKRVPRADGPGYDVDRVVKLAFDGDSTDFDASSVDSRRVGTGRVELGSGPNDPLGALGPTDVVGGAFTVGDFTLGYGEDVTTRSAVPEQDD